MTGWIDVFLYASLTAVATGFGALPFLLFPKFSRVWLGISNAIAAGLMLAASFGLFFEGLAIGVGRVVLGIVLGLAFIALTQRALDSRPEMQVGALRGADARKALLIVGIMTLHSVTEGVGVGVAFGGGIALGTFITVAIAIHNIPEGLAISLVLVPRGVSVWRAAWWSVFSSLPQPLLAVPAFLFVETFRPVLPVGLGFAGGAMVWMVFGELVPDALEDASKHTIAIAVTLSVAAMLVFQTFLKW